MAPKPRRFTIAVPTAGRPTQLRVCLESVLGDSVWDRSRFHLDEVLVVDNDCDAATAEYVMGIDNEAAVSVRYVAESQRGVVAVRNKAVAEAIAGGSDVLVMLDDDEVVAEAWPGALLEASCASDAILTGGPVAVQPAVDVEAFMLTPDFLTRSEPPRDEPPDLISASNIAINLGEVAGDPFHGAPFDAAFGASGGEDTRLSIAVKQSGGRLAYAHNARLVEPFPEERCSIDWLRPRWRRDATNLARASIAGSSRPLAERARWVARGVARVAFGCTAAFVCRSRSGAPPAVAAQRWRCLGLGMVLGAIGHTPSAYGNANGRSRS